MNILPDIYYDPKNSGSFAGVKSLYMAAKQVDPNITYKEVKDWLSGEITYTLHKPVRKTFKRNKIIVNGIDDQWEADLVDMREFKSKNSNYQYLLTVIDCFSKYAFVRPIKTKTGVNIVNALKPIFAERRPLYLRTDRGTEFLNTEVQKYLKSEKVIHFTSKDQKIKCAIVERFNRTLKNRMFRHFTSIGRHRYLENLQDHVNAYNHSVHRSTKFRSIDVNKDIEKQVFQNLYGCNDMRELLKQNKNKLFKSDIKDGDKVRKAYNFKPFDRGFYPNYTDQIFTIEKTIKGDKQIVFRLRDYSGNLIEQRFYPEELQKIKENLHRIERIIRTRTRRGVRECLVKWLNYPESYNSWIPETDITNINGRQD